MWKILTIANFQIAFHQIPIRQETERFGELVLNQTIIWCYFRYLTTLVIEWPSDPMLALSVRPRLRFAVDGPFIWAGFLAKSWFRRLCDRFWQAHHCIPHSTTSVLFSHGVNDDCDTHSHMRCFLDIIHEFKNLRSRYYVRFRLFIK